GAPVSVVAAFVPAAQVVDGDAVAVLGAVQPVDHVVGHVGGPEGPVADPAGCAPGQPDEPDARVTGLGLLHQPPLVATVAVQIARGVLVAGFGAAGGVRVAADLDFQALLLDPWVYLADRFPGIRLCSRGWCVGS